MDLVISYFDFLKNFHVSNFYLTPTNCSLLFRGKEPGYVCVCVCVCVRERLKNDWNMQNRERVSASKQMWPKIMS